MLRLGLLFRLDFRVSAWLREPPDPLVAALAFSSPPGVPFVPRLDLPSTLNDETVFFDCSVRLSEADSRRVLLPLVEADIDLDPLSSEPFRRDFDTFLPPSLFDDGPGFFFFAFGGLFFFKAAASLVPSSEESLSSN